MRFLDVIMSVYNGESHLAPAIESILEQTYSDFKFIIVDNGSTDKTPEILAHYAQHDNRIELLRNTRTVSYVEGRMKAIAHSTGEWFANMDADDVSDPERLTKQVAFIQKQEGALGCVGSWARYIDADGNIVGNRRTRPFTNEQFKQMLNKQEAILVTDPSAVINKKLFQILGGYRTDCVPAADLDLFYRIAEAGKLVVAIPEYLMQYRIHSGADSVKKFMLQRLKTHYINHNMRNRRSGLEEIEYLEFYNKIWSKWSYKFPRLWKDYAKSLYKEAGMLYFNKKYFQMSLCLLIASIMWPRYVMQRLFSHKFNKGYV